MLEKLIDGTRKIMRSSIGKFEKDIINEFWNWVTNHQENETIVEYDGKGKLCIWIDFNDLEDFTSRYVVESENRIGVTLFNNCICVELNDVIGGYSGFSMIDVWESRPSE